MNINSNFICKSPKLETIQMLISMWVDNLAYSYYEILFSNEKQATDIHNIMEESQKRYVERK